MELLPLVCLCLLSCSGDAVRVVVEEGSDAVLPCLISPKEDLTGKAFDWKKDGQDVFFHDPIGHTNQGRDFTDRVSHFEDQLQNGNASIKITRTKMADSGNYSCIFPNLQSQTSIIELVVGAAPEPVIKILAETKHWRLLQCEAHGDPLPTVEWKDSDNNTLPADTPQISVRGGRSYITVKITVTKTGRYRCVATQEKFSHRIAANTSVLLAAVRVVVEEDSDAVLPCLISTEEDISGKFFDWRKDGQKEVFMYDAGVHYNNGLPGQDEQFKGRVSFFQDQLQNGDASIKITRTKMADSGNYSCDFPRHQPRQTSIIELVVARVRVVVEEGSDAVLPCLISTEEDITGKLFDWKKDGQKQVFTHDTSDNYPNRGQDEQFKGRVSVFQDQLQNGNASIKITRTKMADSGNYSCIFPHLQSQTSIIELVVGAASKPYVTTIKTDDGVMLQCEVVGASPKPKVEWKDSSGNVLPVKDLKETKRGDSYDIVLQAAVTKTDSFHCVVTQEDIDHEIEAKIDAVFVPPPDPGSNTGVIVVVTLVITLLVVGLLLFVLLKKGFITLNCSRRNTANRTIYL